MSVRRPNPVGAAPATGGVSADQRDAVGIARLAQVAFTVDHVAAAAKSAVAAGR